MHHRLDDFLEQQDVLYDKQFGFRKKNSTIYALIEMIEKIKETIDNGKFGCGIFIDLKKAFDTVNHEILLKKLEHYGIRGTMLKWFESYLGERKQFVFFNGESSDHMNIHCGVPQGSVLGPLLFLIYINDLPNVSEKLFIYLFADDTNLYYESEDLQVLESVLNRELKQLSQWLKVNRLALNITKSNFVIFHSHKRIVHHNVTLLLDKKSILEKGHIKYLGVFIDQHLNWKAHISNISKKISRNIGILYRLRRFVDLSMMKNLYYSIIYSHLVYGIEVWGSACQTALQPIVILQKKSVRMMTFNDNFPDVPGPLCPSNALFSELELLKLSDIYKLHVAKFIFLCLHFLTPSIFHGWFNLTSSIHSYSTTSRCTIITENDSDLGLIRLIPVLHTRHPRLVNYGGKLLQVSGPILWNSIPVSIRESNSISISKHALKKHFLQQYVLH